MTYARSSSLLGLAAALLLGAPLGAQALPPLPGEEEGLVDRVVAVVGDSAIFLTQVEEEMILLNANSDRPIPTDPDERREMMRGVLESLVNLQLVLREAAVDSALYLPLEEEVEARVRETVDQVTRQFNTDAEFQAALAQDGLTPASYRETLRKRIREQQIQQLFVERQLQGGAAVAITEAELRELFEAQKDFLPERPELLTISQIAIRPGASEAEWEAKRVLADSIANELRNGADFSDLAFIFSEDAGNATQGGDLGWFRRGRMVPEFEDVVFRLPDGEISDPVRTDFGWHVIRVDRRRPGEVKARHILLIPQANASDIDRVLARADSAAARARAGEDMALLQELYGEPDESTDLTVSRQQISEQLPPQYGQALAGAGEGDVVGPFAVEVGPARLAVVVKLTEVRPAGELEFADVRARLRQQLQQQKQLERLWETLRSRTYVDIRF